MGLEELSWRRPEELREKHYRGETFTSNDLLNFKSASFFGPIRLLTLAKGDNEQPKELYIRCAYNLLREEDEGEDLPEEVSNNEKIWIIGKFAYIVDDVARRIPPSTPNGGKGIDFIINGSDFQTITQKLIAYAGNEDTRIFAEQFGKGTVLKELYEISEGHVGTKIKEAIKNCTGSMALGMITFLERGPIETSNQLHNYCYQVAGRIGSNLLNRIVEYKDNIILSDENAERFGKYLQLTNIIKNIRSDFEEGRRFLPGQSIHGGISYEYLMNGPTLDAINGRNNMFEKMIKFANDNFQVSADYISSIPKELSGYKAFCLVPFITASKTIEHMRDCGAQRVFDGDKKAIKIPYGIKNIMHFSYNIAKNFPNRANEWLNEYTSDSRKFSFRDEKYIGWVGEYLK